MKSFGVKSRAKESALNLLTMAESAFPEIFHWNFVIHLSLQV